MTEKDDLRRLDYQMVCENIRWLAEVRFKLLATVPTLSGVVLALLTREPSARSGAVMAFATLGLVATSGLLIYDLRNSQLYNALIFRARFLEARLGLDSSGLVRGAAGQFSEAPDPRPAPRAFAVTHGLGLALIYGSSLAAWVSAFAEAALTSADAGHTELWVAGVAALSFAGVVALLMRFGATKKPPDSATHAPNSTT